MGLQAFNIFRVPLISRLWMWQLVNRLPRNPIPKTLSPEIKSVGFTIYLVPGIGHKLTCYAPAWERIYPVFPKTPETTYLSDCISDSIVSSMAVSSIFGIQTTIGGRTLAVITGLRTRASGFLLTQWTRCTWRFVLLFDLPRKSRASLTWFNHNYSCINKLQLGDKFAGDCIRNQSNEINKLTMAKTQCCGKRPGLQTEI